MPESKSRAADFSAKLLGYLQKATSVSYAEYDHQPARLVGGYDTDVYHFRLQRVSGAMGEDLVLRKYPSRDDTRRAVAESVVQNALADHAYPAPRVHLVCEDPDVLGRPFIVMERLRGKPLISTPEPAASAIMGELHARLHMMESGFLVEALNRRNIRGYGLDGQLERIQRRSEALPGLHRTVAWLMENRPRVTRESICHGDFHKLNLLVEDNQVTGVIDWSTFSVMEPEADVVNTIISFSIIARHLTAQGDFERVDLDKVVEDYLIAYQRVRPLNEGNMDYYRVLRSTSILILASLGFPSYRHPSIVTDLSTLVHRVTGIHPSIES